MWPDWATFGYKFSYKRSLNISQLLCSTLENCSDHYRAKLDSYWCKESPSRDMNRLWWQPDPEAVRWRLPDSYTSPGTRWCLSYPPGTIFRGSRFENPRVEAISGPPVFRAQGGATSSADPLLFCPTVRPSSGKRRSFVFVTRIWATEVCALPLMTLSYTQTY